MRTILAALALSMTFPLMSSARDHGDFQRRETAKQEVKSCCEKKGTCCTKDCCNGNKGTCYKDGAESGAAEGCCDRASE